MTHRIRPVACMLSVAMLCLLALAGLRADALAGEHALILPTDPAQLIVKTASGDRSFTIEVADNSSERSRGLMFREQMDDDHGMLFVFETTRRAQFWMKNTPLALDLIFIGADGSIRDILSGEPQSLAVIGPDDPIRFVLELKAGMAGGNGIARGDTVHHPAIDAIARP